jgi:hypothetical protein
MQIVARTVLCGDAPMKRLAGLLVLLLCSPPSADAACKQVKAESDILGIRIADEASSARVLGAWENLPSEQDKTVDGADADFPFVRIRSADGKQDAKLFEHYGAVVGAYAEIEVGPADSTKRAAKQMPAAELSTERGVKLGVRRADLVRLLGTCFRRERGKAGEAIIVYAINDPDHVLLRRAGMPSYFARYAFKDDRLAWFRFGFEYP